MSSNNDIFRSLPLADRLGTIDHYQARRFCKLYGVALELATQSITEHLVACDRMDVEPDPGAIRECIDDALKGRRTFIFDRYIIDANAS